MSTTIPRRASSTGAPSPIPTCGIQFAVPVGFLMQNGTRAVTITGSAGQAQFSGGRYNGTLENYI